jgi:glyoxylase-like metal-dependent hydrolase (beta-lactamase superfamily II)
VTLADRHAWIEEGAHRVAPGVHRIPLPLPSDALRAVNVYAIEAAGGLVLIDSGWALANARDQLERSLARIGAGLPDVRQFLVTHLHRDHYTQAVAIRRLFGTPVAIGAEEKHSIDRLLSSRFRPLGAQLTMLGAAGAAVVADQLAALTVMDVVGSGDSGEDIVPAHVPGAELGAPGHPNLLPGATFAAALGYEAPDEWIAAGQEFDLGTRTLTAIHTPGHTRGHLVFADAAAGLLFAGDHVLPHITPSIGFQPVITRLALDQYLGSLRLMLTLPDARLLPAHGPVQPSTHARVHQLLEHHETRLAQTLEAASDGPVTAFQAAGALPWTRRRRKLTELDPMNQLLATGETAAHLEVLVIRGQLSRETSPDGIDRYGPPVPAPE